MTPEFFNRQIQRLKARFSERAFDPEFVKLIGLEVSKLADHNFEHIVTTMIGSRKHTAAPTIVDFREMRISIEKKLFNRTVDGANHGDRHHSGSVSDALARSGFPGCRSITDAIEVEKLKLQVANAKDEEK